ncbi:MAG: ribonuclease III [Halothiobacillaceae bacterium]|nr:MAG: ribonuclease III [Halothiobacillaceae bacterium]
MTDPLNRLATRLEHSFKDPVHLELAVRHRSAGGKHNERMEFLGDGLLNFVIADELYKRRPRAPEGELSRYRASLVREDTLAELASELQLGDYLVLGSGELKSGGYRRGSTLADALEAVIGAVYLDSGFEPARDLILRLYHDRLEHLPAEAGQKDPKTRLQEWMQARQRDLPDYQVTETFGQAHAQTFVVECRVEGLPEPTQGRGTSRRRAEQAAAEAALEQLQPGSISS